MDSPSVEAMLPKEYKSKKNHKTFTVSLFGSDLEKVEQLRKHSGCSNIDQQIRYSIRNDWRRLKQQTKED